MQAWAALWHNGCLELLCLSFKRNQDKGRPDDPGTGHKTVVSLGGSIDYIIAVHPGGQPRFEVTMLAKHMTNEVSVLRFSARSGIAKPNVSKLLQRLRQPQFNNGMRSWLQDE
mmetsp:Transcript_97924/g.204259  ORF Transcript_97924/g.204259 Transcript_97924/m.204259 type:complete len:113 (+) Transcript_97924:200-538(+)